MHTVESSLSPSFDTAFKPLWHFTASLPAGIPPCIPTLVQKHTQTPTWLVTVDGVAAQTCMKTCSILVRDYAWLGINFSCSRGVVYWIIPQRGSRDFLNSRAHKSLEKHTLPGWNIEQPKNAVLDRAWPAHLYPCAQLRWQAAEGLQKGRLTLSNLKNPPLYESLLHIYIKSWSLRCYTSHSMLAC